MSSDRARLARELHDGIAQDLVAVGYSLDLLLANPETSTTSRSQIRSLRFNVSELIDKVRREIYFLGQPDDPILSKRIASSAIKECSEIELQLDLTDLTEDVDSDMAYEIDRIAQEILRNVAKHSKADKVSVSLMETENAIQLSIRDTGVGGAEIRDGHYGMQSIRDRASAIGADLEVLSDGSGTEVILRVPRRRRADAQL